MSAKATAGDRRPGSLKRGKIGPGRIVLDRRALGALGAGRRIEILFELGDQILERVDLVRQVGGALALGFERLFGGGLLLLPLVDENVHAQLLATEQIEVMRQAVAFVDDVFAHPKRSARSPANASACARMSGTTAPSMIAVRTACKASSGRTRSAGGGCRPTR